MPVDCCIDKYPPRLLAMTSNLLNTLNEISTSLVTLALQVRAEALAGLGSRNKVAEHVLLPVIRRIYSAPGLINANALTANFPGIDLYDPSSCLGVQITSETRAAKITGTIETIAAGTLPIRRLVIALVSETTPRYKASTRASWEAAAQGRFAFEPAADVFSFDRLLTRIQLLPALEIEAIAAELRALVRGTHAVHLLPHLRQQVENQLSEEQRIARYIPDVFVETQDTKYQARCFAHPVLFVRRIAGWFERQPFDGLNRLAVMSGVPALSPPSIKALISTDTPVSVAAAAKAFIADLDDVNATLERYKKVRKDTNAVTPRDLARAYVLDETRYYIEMNANGLQYEIHDRKTELRCVAARIFLLTGPAGQGKTNFLCDFTELFLLRHDIPCAYITARQLSRIPNPDLTEVVRQLIFPAKITSLDEGLTALAATYDERRQPFVLVIDGLNEHPDFRAFAGQLEHLLETLVRYPHVRVLMTCRSEFLEQRFGTLLSGPLNPVLHISKAHGQRFDDDQYQELVSRYFQFFEVRSNLVSQRVITFLRQDLLLLRFFCEAYGARGRDSAYEQPFIAGVYRDEIFRRYVEDKMGRAHHTVANDRSTSRSIVRPADIRRVLSLVAAYMLETGHYADVPRSVVPAELDAELAAVLDEELILRRDIGSAPSLLAEPPEVLNFTFDEMRDFLLVQHLLGVFAQDHSKFTSIIAKQQPATAESLEGLQRFLFYASRVPTNRVFFDSYRTHPWYTAVYDAEVFAVPPTHLDADDQQSVEMALTAGGDRARHFARQLALHWEASIFPVLNLDLLLAIARRTKPSFFADVITPTFAKKNYGQKSLGEAFCHFVEEEVFPHFSPEQVHPYDPIFRLLLLLLPVGATPTLNSPAVAVFQQLISKHPNYALGLLQEALDDGRPWNRAFIWRLLCMVVNIIDVPASIVAAAQVDVAQGSSSTIVRHEAERFLARFPSD